MTKVNQKLWGLAVALSDSTFENIFIFYQGNKESIQSDPKHDAQKLTVLQLEINIFANLHFHDWQI